jgi:periplasmic protein CpxP/Spy
MTFSSLRLALLAGLALPLGLASASLAQDAPPAPAPADAAGMHHDHAWGDHHDVDPAARRAHMMQHLRDVLQLQPAQEAALAAFIDSIKPPGDMRPDMEHARPDMAHVATPERLDKMMARFDEMHAHMVARVAATKQFYAQLSPSQQKAFDDLAPMMMGRFGHDHGMEGHFHHGDGDGHQMGPGLQPAG